MASEWTITELPRGEHGTAGETFIWTSDIRPTTPQGGGRAAPRAPWTFGGQQRNKRTDYPGSRTPSVQVLGPASKPFTLEGSFDDRYNGPGYAVAELKRLEAMLERGNLCQISFQDQEFLGLFTDWSFPYRRAWQIGYSLTFDVHARPETYNRSELLADIDISPAVAYNNVDLAVSAALASHDRHLPRSHVVGKVAADVDAALASVVNAVDQLGRTLDNREIVPPENPVDGFTRIGTQFSAVHGAAYEVLVELAGVRSDTELSVQTAMAVLDFENWSRSVRFAARIAMGRSLAGHRACAARAEPDAKRLYRPQQGESLYAIARKFYGAPHAWRLIYDRNHLTSVALTGDEILIIPERG